MWRSDHYSPSNVTFWVLVNRIIGNEKHKNFCQFKIRKFFFIHFFFLLVVFSIGVNYLQNNLHLVLTDQKSGNFPEIPGRGGGKNLMECQGGQFQKNRYLQHGWDTIFVLEKPIYITKKY